MATTARNVREDIMEMLLMELNMTVSSVLVRKEVHVTWCQPNRRVMRIQYVRNVLKEEEVMT